MYKTIEKNQKKTTLHCNTSLHFTTLQTTSPNYTSLHLSTLHSLKFGLTHLRFLPLSIISHH